MRISKLEPGQTFIWRAQPSELHQMTGEVTGDGKVVANHIATRTDEGTWRFHEPRPQNWNAYCNVKVVTINVQ